MTFFLSISFFLQVNEIYTFLIYHLDTLVTFFFFYIIALDRMSGYSIYAFYDDTFDNFASLDPNNLVYHHDPMSGCLPRVQNITINKPARQVVFTIHRTTEFQSSCTDNSNIHTGVEICEIKVMGK